MIILEIIGLASIYSTTFNSTNAQTGEGAFAKQMIMIFGGIIIYVIVTTFDFRWLREVKVIGLIYFVTLGLLVYVLYFTAEVAGTHRWINLGPINIQPSELAKLSIIIITSAVLIDLNKQVFISEIINKRKHKYKLNHDFNTSKPNYFKIALSAILATPIVFLILKQPSFGNTIISVAIFSILVLIYYPNKVEILTLLSLFLLSLGMYIIFSTFGIGIFVLTLIIFALLTIAIINYSKANMIMCVIAIIAGAMLFPITKYGWNNVLHDYQKERIEIFINPEKDPKGAGWQVKQSKIAIGSGRIFGKGWLEGTQTNLKILPYAHTDFIFAAYAEQFGLVGAFILILLLLSLPSRVLKIAMNHPDPFAKLINYGIGAMFFIHIFINIGMNLGVLPITGIPLPFISYGGSSVLVNMIALGLVQNTLKYDYNQENVEII